MNVLFDHKKDIFRPHVWAFLFACDFPINPVDMIPVGIAVRPMLKNIINALSILPGLIMG